MKYKKSFVLVILSVAGFMFIAASNSQDVPSPSQEPSITVGDKVIEASVGDTFHRNVIRSAIKAKREGTITQRQLRLIRVAMISPAFRSQAKELAEIQMLSSGESDKIPKIGENIDWDALLAFIEKLIPLILKLIDVITSLAMTIDPTITASYAFLETQNAILGHCYSITV